MNRFLLLILLCGLLCPNCYFTPLVAQSPYRPTWGKTLSVLGGGAVLWGAADWLGARQKPLSEEAVRNLSVSQVPRFDRVATRHYSLKAQRASDILLRSQIFLPGLLLADPSIRRDAGRSAVVAGSVFLANYGLVKFVKVCVQRTRPLAYNPNAPMEARTHVDARRSFYSGHASMSAAMSMVTARIWCDHHPNSKWKPAVWAGAAVAPVITGILRVKGGKHFPSDVVTGLVVGGALGGLLPNIFVKT